MLLNNSAGTELKKASTEVQYTGQTKEHKRFAPTSHHMCGDDACKSAISVYKRGRDFVSRWPDDSLIMRAAKYYPHMWNNLGLALKRFGELDMAKRACLWALAMPPALRGRPNCESSYMSVRADLISLSQSREQSEETLRRSNYESLERASQRKECKGMCNILARSAGCKATSNVADFPVCSKCKVASFCIQECLAKHWPRHKSECRAYRKASQSE